VWFEYGEDFVIKWVVMVCRDDNDIGFEGESDYCDG
jgi:hypothetical protein